MDPAIGAPSRGERVREFARCHALVAVLFGAGLVLRVLTTLTYRPAMQFVQDSFDCLHDAEQMAPSVAACGFVTLLVASATVAFDYRFLMPTLALLPPAGVIGATLLEQRLRR